MSEPYAQDLSHAQTTQSDEDAQEASRISNRWDRMETAAINWKTHWQECYENIVPRKEDVISSRLPGDRRDSDLYDSTAVLANEMLASALHGFLTNPESRFFEITFGDPRLDELEEVKAWCQDTGDRMFRVLNNTNFQTEIYEIYIDLSAIGTSCLYMGDHPTNVVHFSARAMKEIRIDENSLGVVDVVYRCYKTRPSLIIEEFGKENCPDDLLKAAEKESSTGAAGGGSMNSTGVPDEWEVVHAVEPMGKNDKPSPKKHSFKSTYVLKNKKWILSKDGFREFPYAVSRWSKTSGEIYGRGPGMHMLPDIMMVNAMMLTVIQGAQMTVNPPLMVTDDGVIGSPRLTPGGLTVVRPTAGGSPTEAIKPLITDARIDFGEKMVEDVRNRIRAGFYVDQFQLAQGPQKTAEEVRQEVEQKLRLMGPVMGRQHWELLKPVITRLFDIMWMKGEIPDPPAAIKGKEFNVRYSSMIARAQRVSEATNIGHALQAIGQMAQVKPAVADIVDEEKVGRRIWEIYGNPHGLLRSQSELKKMRAAQAEQAKQAQEMKMQEHQANVAKGTAPLVAAAAQAQQSARPAGPA